MILRAFSFEHNVSHAIRQEYDLARQHYDDVCAHRNVFDPAHTERFRDARDRLNRARELMIRG